MDEATAQELAQEELGAPVTTEALRTRKPAKTDKIDYEVLAREEMAKSVEGHEAPKKEPKKPTLWETIKSKFLGDEKKPTAAGAPTERPKPKLIDVSQVPTQYKAMAEEENRRIQEEAQAGPAKATGRRVEEPDALEGLVDAYALSEAKKKPAESKQPEQITTQAGERFNVPASEFDPYAELTNAKRLPATGPLGRALQTIETPDRTPKISALQAQKPTGIAKMLSPEFWGGPEDIAKSKNIVALQGMLTDQKNVAEGAELEKKDESLAKSVKEVGDLKQKIEDRSADVEKARKLKDDIEAFKVDKEDRSSVQQYNNLINKYNAQVKTLKGFNELVTTHNKKLEGLKADMDAFNQQAMKYSPKGIPPLNEIAKNYDAITKELDIRGDMTGKEFTSMLMRSAIALSFYAAPVKLMLGLGIYEVVKEYESVVTQMTKGEKPKFGQGAELKDLVQAAYPSTSAEPYNTVMDLVEFFGPAGASGAFMKGVEPYLNKATAAIATKYFRNITTDIKPDATYTLDKDRLRKFQTMHQKEDMTEEEAALEDIFLRMNLPKKDFKDIFSGKKTIEIDVPGRTITKVQDTDSWAKVKGFFRINEPIEKVFGKEWFDLTEEEQETVKKVHNITRGYIGPDPVDYTTVTTKQRPKGGLPPYEFRPKGLIEVASEQDARGDKILAGGGGKQLGKKTTPEPSESTTKAEDAEPKGKAAPKEEAAAEPVREAGAAKKEDIRDEPIDSVSKGEAGAGTEAGAVDVSDKEGQTLRSLKDDPALTDLTKKKTKGYIEEHRAEIDALEDAGLIETDWEHWSRLKLTDAGKAWLDANPAPGLLPAIEHEGEIHVGQEGETHSDIAKREGIPGDIQQERGFVATDKPTEYLDREQALGWVEDNEKSVHKKWLAREDKKYDDLHSEDYWKAKEIELKGGKDGISKEDKQGHRGLDEHGAGAREPGSGDRPEGKEVKEGEAKAKEDAAAAVLKTEAIKINDLVTREKQPFLDKIGKEVAEEAEGEYYGVPKSVRSLEEKVYRRQESKPEYTIWDEKDHARGTVKVKTWADAPAVIKDLMERGFTVESSIEEPLNLFGYRGITGTMPLGDKLNGEIQIHSPESAVVKEHTDPIYRDRRSQKAENLSKEEEGKYWADVKDSVDSWAGHWDTVPEDVKAAISAAVRGLPSEIAPTVKPAGTGPRLPSGPIKKKPSPLDTSITLPSSSLEKNESDISKPPVDHKVAQKGDKVKGKDEPDLTEKEKAAKKGEADLTPKEIKNYLIDKIDDAIKVAPEGTAEGMITIEVPGDGTFKVANEKERLMEFKKRVAAGGYKSPDLLRIPKPSKKPTGEEIEGKEERGGATLYSGIDPTLLAKPIYAWIDQDARKNLRSASADLVKLYDDMKRMSMPQMRGQDAAEFAREMTSYLGRAARYRDAFVAATEQFHKFFNKQTNINNLKFMGDVNSGEEVDPDLQTLVDIMKQGDDDRIALFESVAPDEVPTLREHYFGMIWKRNAEDAAKKRNQIMGKRPLSGTKAFKKKKVWEDFDDYLWGVENGYEPVSWNPLDIKLLKYKDLDDFIISRQIFAYGKEQGYVKFVRAGRNTPEGFVDINDRMAEVYYRNEDKELVKAGKYVMSDGPAQVLNNYLSKSLYNTKFGPIYKAYMGIGNFLNMAQLFGAFHANFITRDMIHARGAIAIDDIYRLITGKEKDWSKLNGLWKTPAAVVDTLILGRKLTKAWYFPGSQGPDAEAMVQRLMTSWAQPHMDAQFRSKYLQGMVNAWKNSNPIGALLRLPGTLVELGVRPIFHYLVPWAKMGAQAMLDERFVMEHPKATHEELLKALNDHKNHIDARMGMVNYTRLYINNKAKNLAQMFMRAPGWTGGNIWLLGKMAIDTLRLFRDIYKEKKLPDHLPLSHTYNLAMLLTSMVISGMLSSIFTTTEEDLKKGEIYIPKGLDFLFFRTGNLDERGNPERFMSPSYLKDYYAYWKHPGKTLFHKQHPLTTLVSDLLIFNKDYYGTEIMHRDDPAWTQAWQGLKYAGKNLLPFSVQGIIKQVNRKASPEATVLPAIGEMPAPARMADTKFQEYAYNLASNKREWKTRTQEQTEKAQLKNQLEMELRKKSPEAKQDIVDAVKERKISAKDRQYIQEKAKENPIVRSVKSADMTLDELAKGITELATPAEKAILKPLFKKKLMNKAGELSADKKREYLKVLNE